MFLLHWDLNLSPHGSQPTSLNTGPHPWVQYPYMIYNARNTNCVHDIMKISVQDQKVRKYLCLCNTNFEHWFSQLHRQVCFFSHYITGMDIAPKDLSFSKKKEVVQKKITIYLWVKASSMPIGKRQWLHHCCT